MNVYHSFQEAPKKPWVFTFGFFDGVHRGHVHLLQALDKMAEALSAHAAVVSFWPHPKEVLNDVSSQLMQTLEEKVLTLEACGVEHLFIIPFNQSLAKLHAAAFLEQEVLSVLDLQGILLGHDHGFGADRLKGLPAYELLGKRLGFTVKQVDAYQSNGISISSSLVRDRLMQGDIAQVNEFLGYTYSLQGTVVVGKQIGRDLGFPTANLALSEKKLLPKAGVYIVHVGIRSQMYAGMLNIGTRPTLSDGRGATIEVHIFDWTERLYGENLRVFFVHRLRDEQAFASLSDLRSQLEEDERAARSFLFLSAQHDKGSPY